MNEIIELKSKTSLNPSSYDGFIEVTEGILADARSKIPNQQSISIPIAQLATLGAGVASLIPVLRTVTQTTTCNTHGLYQLANAGVGDVLKVAKNSNFWGAFKTPTGASKFVQLQAAGPLAETSTTVMPIDPATIMMAVALFSIEQQLGKIEAMGKQILSFLELEKESEIEADIETLSSIVSKYKFNWDNEYFIASNHKMVLDIQRTARKNMNLYQKKVCDVLNSKQIISSQAKVNSTLNDLLKKFKYYRLSLFAFSMASFAEIILSGDFKEENIICTKNEIENLSITYREIYGQCSFYLEKLSSISVETAILKSVGSMSNKIGGFIGSIPVIKDGLVDEFLQDSGSKIKKSAVCIEKKVLASFTEICNPGTGMFTEEMQKLIQIYGHTSDICFDEKNIYLITA